MSEEELSKRERQKVRRQAKREQEYTERRKARTRRTLTYGIVIALVLGLSGYAVAGWWSERQREQELKEEALARLDELGCSEVVRPPNQGAGHLTGENIQQFPPDEIYPDRPTASGLHMNQWVLTGVYDKRIDERLLVHNLEHGYVNVYHTEDADPAEVEELKRVARARIEGPAKKIIVAPWDGPLPDDANFAFLAWNARQLCEQFEEGVLLAFLDEYHHLAGEAPEKENRPHLRTGEGIDPNATEGDLLLPPLGQSEGGGPAMEEDGSVPEGTEEPTDGQEGGGTDAGAEE